MSHTESGKVILEAIENGDAEERVLAYLSKLFHNIPPPLIGILVKRRPALLIEDIPASVGTQMVEELKTLGATARFTPDVEEQKPDSDSHPSFFKKVTSLVQAFGKRKHAILLMFLSLVGLCFATCVIYWTPIIRLTSG